MSSMMAHRVRRMWLPAATIPGLTAQVVMAVAVGHRQEECRNRIPRGDHGGPTLLYEIERRGLSEIDIFSISEDIYSR